MTIKPERKVRAVCLTIILVILSVASILLIRYRRNEAYIESQEPELSEAEATEPKRTEVKAYRVPGIEPGGEEKTEKAPVQEPVKEKITPVLSEEEILNMSDDEFMNYGQLVFDGLLNEAYPHIAQSEEYKELIGHAEELSSSVSRAYDSAYSSSDAKAIASEFWRRVNEYYWTKEAIQYSGSLNGMISKGIIGENDKFWIFKGDCYEKNIFLYSKPLIIFKSDYYDSDQGKVGFELNEENVKLFFDLVYEEQYRNMCICIGEFVSQVEDGFEFRRYYIDVQYYMDFDEWDNTLLKKTWHISDDGIVNKPDPESEVVREWNSHEWHLWQIYGDDWKL